MKTFDFYLLIMPDTVQTPWNFYTILQTPSPLQNPFSMVMLTAHILYRTICNGYSRLAHTHLPPRKFTFFWVHFKPHCSWFWFINDWIYCSLCSMKHVGEPLLIMSAWNILARRGLWLLFNDSWHFVLSACGLIPGGETMWEREACCEQTDSQS